MTEKPKISVAEPSPARSHNALVHGLYAKDVLLPWESKEEFKNLHEDLKAEFSPRGRAEEEAVLDLAFLHWHKQTIWRMWATTVLNDPFTQDIVDTERKSWSGIRKCLRAAAKDQRSIRGMADANLAKLMSRLERLGKKMAAASDKEEINLILDKITALLVVINQCGLPLLERLTKVPNAEQTFEKAYATESMEKILRLEAALDARIAKVLARLVGLKEFKRTPAGGAATMALSRPANR